VSARDEPVHAVYAAGDVVEGRWAKGRDWLVARVLAYYPAKTKSREPHVDLVYADGLEEHAVVVSDVRAPSDASRALALTFTAKKKGPATYYVCAGCHEPDAPHCPHCPRYVGSSGAALEAKLAAIKSGDRSARVGPKRVSLTIGGNPPAPRKKRRAKLADPLDALRGYLTWCGGDGVALAEGWTAGEYVANGVDGRASYVSPAGEEFKSRSQVAASLGLHGGADHLEVYWCGGVGAWYAAVRVAPAGAAGKTLVRYEDGFEERVKLAPEPWAGGPVAPADVDRARAALWRAAGQKNLESGAALLDMDPP